MFAAAAAAATTTSAGTTSFSSSCSSKQSNKSLKFDAIAKWVFVIRFTANAIGECNNASTAVAVFLVGILSNQE